MSDLSSRERMLAVLRYQEPDHVPLVFNSFGFEPPAHLAWSNPVEEAERWLSLGVDAWLRVSVPLLFHPDVTVREWTETIPGERWPVMMREYETPAGVIRQGVYRTDDWISPDWPGHKTGSGGIELLDDLNVPRFRRFPIQNAEDVEKLRYLLNPLPDGAIAQFREQAAEVARQAEQLGVLLVGYEPAGADMATWLCGVEGMLFMAMDQPDVFSALLDVVHEWDKRNMEIMVDTPMDLVLRRGYYEGAIFWSPDLYRRFFAPPFRELTDTVHQCDRLMGYTMSVGVMPLLDMLVDIGYDVHYLLDPIQHGTRIELRNVKSTFDKQIAVIGGLNEPITLEQGTREQIRQEVFDAVRILGPGGGLALTPAEAIVARTPWESIETVIEAWREVRDYPIV